MLIKTLFFIFLVIVNLYAAPIIAERNTWVFADTNTTKSGVPSNLKFLKFYDVLPDEIALQVLEKRDLSAFAGKHIYIGYGIVDPHGKDCRVFPPSTTGLDQEIRICLPWWRIERTYQKSLATIDDIQNVMCSLHTPHPPIGVNVCKQWADNGELYTTGGKVTCTSYYNRLDSSDCWNNPKQAKCFMDNCSDYVKNNCKEVGKEMGDKNNLVTAVSKELTFLPTDTKISVLSHQYNCPSGVITQHVTCEDEKTVLMYPHQCTQDTNTTKGEWTYCDENSPQYDAGGKIIGFLGHCSDGKEIICDANAFSQTTRTCVEPLETTITTTSFKNTNEKRHYDEYSVDVLSGELDVFAANPNCVRSNTIDAARDRIITAHIKGSGKLDDDVWVVRHRGDGTHYTVYCNEQHNENHDSKKMYDGTMEQCIDNNGDYSFNQNIDIDSTDIVTVQEATENENGDCTAFGCGRTHYGSTVVKIDGVVACPNTFTTNFPYYPTYGGWLNTWENTLGNLAILFPYAGSYQITFYNKDGSEVAHSSLNVDDFENMKSSFIKLNLSKQMELSPSFTPDVNSSCLDDDWTEWGGGIHGGKGSITGDACQSPDDNFVKSHAVYKIIVKDLLTGNITPIPLIYPIAYPNRIFVSKLKIYELRKYRCYKPFTEDVLP